ncbi:hypothetical protein SY2F82_34520 [Streptomyces sp. Y2F8-2]|nr:hypothetical protein SY2F82_34520 [Streptomyces sp. Y2F8-2]
MGAGAVADGLVGDFPGPDDGRTVLRVPYAVRAGATDRRAAACVTGCAGVSTLLAFAVAFALLTVSACRPAEDAREPGRLTNP